MSVALALPGNAAQVRQHSVRRARPLLPWLLLSPLLLLLAAFTYWPLLHTIYLSVVDVRLFQPDRFVGLANYVGLFRSPSFAAANLLWAPGDGSHRLRRLSGRIGGRSRGRSRARNPPLFKPPILSYRR